MTFFVTDEPAAIRFGGQVIRVKPDETVLFWGAIPHQLVTISPSNIQYWITIPPPVFLRWDLPQPVARHLLNGKILVETDPAMRELDKLFFPTWRRESLSPDKTDKMNLLLSFETRFRRFENFSVFPQAGAAALHGKMKEENPSFLKMYDYITKNFKKPLSTELIAREVGLHPNYAITLFRNVCGISITEFVQMLRVYEAQRLLLSSRMKIGSVATAAGFGSRTMFYDCFDRFCGKMPGTYRKSMSWEGFLATPPEKIFERMRRERMYDGAGL